MRIMLSYWNDLTVFLATIFKKLNFEIDYAGKPTKKTSEVATKYAPEAWCFDTKLILGQIIEGVRRGDDILAVPGSWGGNNENCLLGYLTGKVLQNKAEKAVGKKVKIWHFNINPIGIIFSAYTEAYKNIAMLRQYQKIKSSRTEIISAIILATKRMRMAAKLKEKILKSADVIDKIKMFSIYDNFMLQMIDCAEDLEKSRQIFRKAEEEISKLKRKKLKKKLRIGLIGDYDHTLFSIFPIFDIEKFLLSHDIFIEQPLSFANYYNVLSPIYSSKNRAEARKIFPKPVTGSDKATILAANYLKNKVDGLVHIRTFSCTPEEVANEVLISHKEMFPPMLSLQFDAHTTEENMKVRIEAFIDMLSSKREK